MSELLFILHMAFSASDTHVENATPIYSYDSMNECMIVAEVVNEPMPELYFFCTTEDQAINY